MMMKLSKSYRIVLWCVSVIGLLGVNGLFLFSILFRPGLIGEAMGNLYALAFIIEAFLLLPLLCFLIAAFRMRSPNWLGFLVLSIAGSLAFSIPFCILLWTRKS